MLDNPGKPVGMAVMKLDGPRLAIGEPEKSGGASDGEGKCGLTGVLSSSISSVADAAASIRSSQRFPKSTPVGSADKAFLSPPPGLKKSDPSFWSLLIQSEVAAPFDFFLW